VFSLVFAPLCVAADDLTINEALALALKQSPRLELFDWDQRIADARIVQARLRPNPELEIEFEDVRLDDGPEKRTRTSTFGATIGGGTLPVPVGGGNVLNLPVPMVGSSGSRGIVRGSGAQSGFRESEITVSLSQTIEIGGKRAKRLRLAQRERELATWNYEAARADVIAETLSAFVFVLGAQDRLSLAHELLELSALTERTIDIRVEAGKVSPLESSKASIAHANERIAVNDAKHDLASARARLVSMWGGREAMFTKAVGALSDVYPIPEFAELIDAIDANPDVARWVDEISAREAQFELARARRLPNPTVWLGVSSSGLEERDSSALKFNRGAGVDFSRSHSDFGTSREERLKFGVRWPLPIFNRNQGAAEEARHQVSKAAAERRMTESVVFASLSSAYELLAAAKERAEALDQDVLPRAQETHTKSLRGYEAGKFELLDVLDAQRAWFQARNDYLDAVTAFHQYAVDVERLSGIGIGPGSDTEEDEES
jgi:cobalt-zinc-cadmium efflux system outer membrane protein